MTSDNIKGDFRQVNTQRLRRFPVLWLEATPGSSIIIRNSLFVILFLFSVASESSCVNIGAHISNISKAVLTHGPNVQRDQRITGRHDNLCTLSTFKNHCELPILYALCVPVGWEQIMHSVSLMYNLLWYEKKFNSFD